MQCPQCGSTEFRKLSLVYAGGFSDLNAHSRGWGIGLGLGGAGLGLGRAKTKGQLQTRLSRLASPPRKKPYWPILLAWLMGIFIGGWFLGYLHTIGHSSDTLFAAQLTWFTYIFSGLIVLVLGVLLRFNRKLFPQRYRLWDLSFMCRCCGNIVQQAEQGDRGSYIQATSPAALREGR
ncbi:MAG: hypothetical protein ACRD22_09715 [Terriglobia bacterium]